MYVTFVLKGGGGWGVAAAAEVYIIFERKERFCVSPKIFEIDPHHADTNLQADIFNGGGVPPSSAFFGDFMILEVLCRL